MNEKRNDDLQTTGIRSDRIMTSREVMNAALNQEAVKQRKETKTGWFEWLLIGIGMTVILIATIEVLLEVYL